MAAPLDYARLLPRLQAAIARQSLDQAAIKECAAPTLVAFQKKDEERRLYSGEGVWTPASSKASPFRPSGGTPRTARRSAGDLLVCSSLARSALRQPNHRA